MKVGGQILWNVTPICETSQIYCLMGRRPMKDVLGNLLMDLLFHLVHWLSIILLTAKDQSRIHVLIADLEELETMDASEIYSKILNAKEVAFPKKMEIHISNRRWTNQTPWRRSGTENTHLDTRTPNLRRRSRRFSWRIRRVSSTTSRLVSGCGWSGNWLLVHVRKLHIPPTR